jgi:putative endonuclease
LSAYYVYILRCADDSFYVGSAQDLDSRLKAHIDGRGAAYTFKRERQLKRWSYGKKEALVAGDLGRLKHLGKRRR